MVIHCLTGNLLRALIGFGWLDDARVGRAIAWETSAITGEGDPHFNAIAPGPGFRCGANAGLPCAWGATKVLLALARIPPDRRSAETSRAIELAAELLLGRDPAVADYPMGYATKPSSSWFKLGFPSGYVADVLQVLEAVCAAGYGHDPRLGRAVDWVVDRQDGQGRWANGYAYAGKMIIDIDRPGRPSPWVTLRACRVLRAVA
jgi:hypothetical protein